LDDNDVVVTAGFLVIPEYWLGTILGLGGCFAAFGGFYMSKRKNSRHTRASDCATRFCEKALTDGIFFSSEKLHSGEFPRDSTFMGLLVEAWLGGA